MKISRRALYEAVWSKPVRTLAREWGISDVGLAKACRKHDIPLPPVGYWAKEAVGRAPEKLGLGGNLDIEVAFDGAPSLKKQPLSDGTKQQLEAALQATAALVDKNSAPPLARWTKKTQSALCRKPDANGFVTAGKDAFRVSVSKGLVERAVQVLNTIETALSAAGMDWTVVEGQGAVVGKLLGVAVSFRLDERYRRTEHVDFPASIRRAAKNSRLIGEKRVRAEPANNDDARMSRAARLDEKAARSICSVAVSRGQIGYSGLSDHRLRWRPASRAGESRNG